MKTLQECKDEVGKKYAHDTKADNWTEFWHDCISHKRFQSLHLAMNEAAELYASQFKASQGSSEEQNGWISVKERLPEGDGLVECIVWRDWGMNIGMKMARFNTKTQNFLDSIFNIVKGITHWQPLPSPPHNQEQNNLSE